MTNAPVRTRSTNTYTTTADRRGRSPYSVGQIRGQAPGCHSVKGALTCGYALFRLCPGRDLNPHARMKQRILSPPCLPIPPPGPDDYAKAF